LFNHNRGSIFCQDKSFLLFYKRKQGCPPEKERDSSGAFETPVQGVGIIESQLFICD